ncbi:hypothetical protein E1162_06065, partial [Rhodobacteraceae bacterium RKSG542]|uniref:hypothetical protein n=1 Tax=Pseudovibrio flavus TaxID=2529854 RepID=UPI00211BF481
GGGGDGGGNGGGNGGGGNGGGNGGGDGNGGGNGDSSARSDRRSSNDCRPHRGWFVQRQKLADGKTKVFRWQVADRCKCLTYQQIISLDYCQIRKQTFIQ